MTTAAARTATADLALVRRYPALTGALPRHALTALPTPVHALDRLARARGLGGLWVKRDDQSGPLYGGNKPRKLEWLLGAAQARGRRALLTFGGIGTHHGLATAVCGRDAGMRAILVLLPQPVTEHVRRCLLLDHAYGAELHFVASVRGAVSGGLRALAAGWRRGEPPEIVPTGGTSALSTIGYVNAAYELADQVRAGLLPAPDAIFVPLGSGGTVAGLMLGLKLAGLRSRVIGVLVTDILPPSPGRLAHLARSCERRLRRAGADLPPVYVTGDDVTIARDFLGRGYGDPTDAALAAQALLDEHEDIHLETTYTGKCLAAMLALAEHEPYRGQQLLFWNTYSSVDPGAAIGPLPDWRELPPAFHRFFTGAL